MFDIGWSELLVIGVVALIVIGPKDLPKLFHQVGHFMGKARGMAREFQRAMEQAARESGLEDAGRDLNAINRSLKSPTSSARKYAEGLVKDQKGEKGEKPVSPEKPEPAAAETPSREPELKADSETVAKPGATPESQVERGKAARR